MNTQKLFNKKLNIRNNQNFTPLRIPNCAIWLDGSDVSSITKTYLAISQTADGTLGTKTITASASVATTIGTGAIIRVNTTDFYTVASVSTVTITTVETLTSNYSAAEIAKEVVSQWSDKSGNARHAIQATSTKQPAYVYNARNGFGGLFLDGSDDSFIISSISLPGPDHTSFWAVHPNNTSGARWFSDVNGVGDNRFILKYSSQTGYTIGSTLVDVNGAGAVTTAHVVAYVFDSNTSTGYIYRNNTLLNSGSYLTRAFSGNYGIYGDSGASFGRLSGYGMEIIAYESALSAEMVGIVSRYIGNKWNISIS